MPGKPAARVGDMTAHGGTISGPGVPTVLIGKMPAATMGDMHVCPMVTPGTPPIPHVGGPITLGSTGVFLGKKPAARMGDMAVCVGPPSSIILGCMTVLIGEAGSGSQAGSAASAEAAAVKGVSAAGALKAMEVPKPVESKLESHAVEIEFKDIAGKLLKGLVFKLKDPNGANVHAASDAEGRYLREGYPQSGSYSAKILNVTDAKCDKSAMKAGDSCTIKAKATGYDDNTLASAYISLIDAEGKAEFFDRAKGKVQGESVEIQWSLRQDLLLEKQKDTSRSPYTDLCIQVVVGFQCATAPWVELGEGNGKVKVRFVEVPDLLFHSDSAVPCLDEKNWLIASIATAVHFAQRNHHHELVLMGHCDSEGKVEYNYRLGDLRGRAVQALFNLDGNAWIAEIGKKNRVDDYQMCLKTLSTCFQWPCDPGKVDNDTGEKTAKAVKAFQKECNARYHLNLVEDGIFGKKSWLAMHRVICGLVAQYLGDIEDPQSADYPSWKLPSYGFSEGDGVYSCGESFPVEESLKEEYNSEKNRRVEFLFIKQGAIRLEAPKDKAKKLDPSTCIAYNMNVCEWERIQLEPFGGYKFSL